MNLEFVKHLDKKIPPTYGGEVNQMFSQRNNPYCELLRFAAFNIYQHHKFHGC